MNFIKDNILNFFLLFPFVVVILTTIFRWAKNPVSIRNGAKTFFCFQFIFSFLILLFFDELKTNLIGYDFSFNKILLIYEFFFSFLFFTISIISKTFITNFHRISYAFLYLLYGLINLFIASENIIITLGTLFWIYLIHNFLSKIFQKKQNSVNFYTLNNLIVLLVSSFFILKDSLKYFILKSLPLNFSILQENLSILDDKATILVFLGFLILVFKLFGLFPFKNENSNTKPFYRMLCVLTSLFMGGVLLSKTYILFYSLFDTYEAQIAGYLVFNLIWFLILILKEVKIADFLGNCVRICSIASIFSIFYFSENTFLILAFSFGILALVYSYSYNIMSVISLNFKTEKVTEFKKIIHKNKTDKFFIITSMLNISFCPFFALFSTFLYLFLVLFSFDRDSFIVNLSGYVVVFSIFVLIYSTVNLANKILVEPNSEYKKELFSNHQIITFLLQLSLIIFFGIFFNAIISYYCANIGSGII